VCFWESLAVLPRLALNSWAQAIHLAQPPSSWDHVCGTAMPDLLKVEAWIAIWDFLLFRWWHSVPLVPGVALVESHTWPYHVFIFIQLKLLPFSLWCHPLMGDVICPWVIWKFFQVFGNFWNF
jgi:hypothetical protein